MPVVSSCSRLQRQRSSALAAPKDRCHSSISSPLPPCHAAPAVTAADSSSSSAQRCGQVSPHVSLARSGDRCSVGAAAADAPLSATRYMQHVLHLDGAQEHTPSCLRAALSSPLHSGSAALWSPPLHPSLPSINGFSGAAFVGSGTLLSLTAAGGVSKSVCVVRHKHPSFHLLSPTCSLAAARGGRRSKEWEQI